MSIICKKRIMPYIVALSGGVASGKSTVANLFAQLGVPIIDADIIARQVVEKGTPALAKIIDHFGKDVLLPSGELNRTKLRNIIFNDPHQRAWLNELLHPIIQQQTDKQIKRYNSPYILWVVPLLIENNLQKQADRILIIDTHADIQLKRLQNRDNIDKNLAKNMLSSQITNEQRLHYADDIIVNNNTQSNTLASQVLDLHKKYLKLSSISN